MSATAAERAKAIGLRSLKEVTDRTGVTPRTLRNWAKHKPALFDTVLKGCVADDYLQRYMRSANVLRDVGGMVQQLQQAIEAQGTA